MGSLVLCLAPLLKGHTLETEKLYLVHCKRPPSSRGMPLLVLHAVQNLLHLHHLWISIVLSGASIGAEDPQAIFEVVSKEVVSLICYLPIAHTVCVRYSTKDQVITRTLKGRMD